ncbi:MAG: SpoIIE family protein phosphatase [Crocinitomix sp.]|nr:SpoIIE family protein phosphatase [Crocinitomix sp.]
MILIGIIADYLQNIDRFKSLQSSLELVLSFIILISIISYFVFSKINYKILFAIVTYCTIVNITLGHIFFFEFPKESVINIFLRDSIFIICITGLSGFVIGKKHAIIQSLLHLIIYINYAFIFNDPFIFKNFGLFILSIFGFGYLIYYAVQTSQKFVKSLEEFHRTVESQKDTIIEKNEEITESILYAKRIQNAILPPSRLVKEYFKESFILYKPKDIVAGDFYWMEDLGDTILFAAADCTGHGVPGAMVSVICHNALNRAVREYRLTDPGEILDKVRSIVIEEFGESDDDVKDGMDIALCALKGNHLKYAGAHNPLWILRNNEIIETKANKEPIGKFHDQNSFTTHSFNLEKADIIYIFSDGLVDQFGGEKEKKFKPVNLRRLLLDVQNQPLLTQRVSINEAFENWKGDLEQVDDVCMIGVKIS